MKQFYFYLRGFAHFRSISLVLLACLTLQVSGPVVYAMQADEVGYSSSEEDVDLIDNDSGSEYDASENASELGESDDELDYESDSDDDSFKRYSKPSLRSDRTFMWWIKFSFILMLCLSGVYIPVAQAIDLEDVNPQEYDVCTEISDNIVLCSRLPHLKMCVGPNDLCYGVLNPALPKEGYTLSTKSFCTTIPVSSGSVSFCLFEKNNTKGPFLCLSTDEFDGIPSSDYAANKDYQFIDSAKLKKLQEKAAAQTQKELDEAALRLAQMESKKCEGALCHLKILAGQGMHAVGNFVDMGAGLAHKVGDFIDKKEKVDATLTPTPAPTPTSTPVLAPTPSYKLVKDIQKNVQSGTCRVHLCLVDIPLFTEIASELSKKLQVKSPDSIDFSSIPALCNLITQNSDDLLKFNDQIIETFIAVVITYEKQNKLYRSNTSVTNLYIASSKGAPDITERVQASVQDIIINNVISQHFDPLFQSELGAIVTEKLVQEPYVIYGSITYGFNEKIVKETHHQCHLISKNDRLKLTIKPEGLTALSLLNIYRITDMFASLATGRPEVLAQGYALLEDLAHKNGPMTISSKRTLADTADKQITNPGSALEFVPDSNDRISYLLELGEQHKDVTKKLIRAYEAITQVEDDSDDL